MQNIDNLQTDKAFREILSNSCDWMEAIEKSDKFIQKFGEKLVYNCIDKHFIEKKIAS